MSQNPSNRILNHELLAEILAQLDPVLPGQGPILDFVHHNTLHGYQHLPFDEALETSENLTGISGYLPERQYRDFYRQGRIDDSDLTAAFAYFPGLRAGLAVAIAEDQPVTRAAVYRAALLTDLSALSVSQLHWQLQTGGALTRVQADVPDATRRRLLQQDDPACALPRLWDSLLAKLALQAAGRHPETLLDLPVEPLESWSIRCGASTANGAAHTVTQQQARRQLDELFGQIGDTLSLSGLVRALSGVDILDELRPQLIRILASTLDEGVAAWHSPERARLGMYRAWRATLEYDANLLLHELPDWQNSIAELPDDPLDAIILQLTRLDISEERWEGYLRRIALELPGWSGMVNWRQHHADYRAADAIAPTLADYLAIRLTLDRLWLNQVCHDEWKVEARISALHGYFCKNLSEFWVRKHLYQGDLPEYLSQQAETLLIRAGSERQCRGDWQCLADRILTWQTAATSEQAVANDAWRLFGLCQHLGLNADRIHAWTNAELQALLAVLNEFNATERSKVWLYAYERHYREALFQALRANQGRGRWRRRETRPDAQIVFCMDDREEGFRRHLEERYPALETLGAAGFFGVAIDYRGIDDDRVTPLCPIVVTPAHEVHEQTRPDAERVAPRHRLGRTLNRRLADGLYRGLRRHPLFAYPLINAIAPVALAGLLGKLVWPRTWRDALERLARLTSPTVATRLSFNAAEAAERAKPGFTDSEQAERIAGLLRNIGLTTGFGECVVLMGHGSISQNNPHIAAYDCGACSGRHGGPNARVFAAMANRPQVRRLLAELGIAIPDDTWFVGAEHNTCSENIDWYDLCDLPPARQPALHALQQALHYAQQMSAHERCRRLASAPRNPTSAEAWAHIRQRAADFSQARPELGHATNAAAVIGRRALTQGLFLDRRVFLISYDPELDPDGRLLEGLLLAVGPVGAGINLEYYFSTVNNEYYGCGSKIPHNITGSFGVMEGTSSDLRTGLPRQMIEIHEAMRLQIVVEAKTSVLAAICARQDGLRELIAGSWVYLNAIDPDTGEIFIFNPDTGFEPWLAEQRELPVCASSADCYRGETQAVAPMLIG